MLDVFMGQCARNAAYFDVTSLNELADLPDADAQQSGLELIDLVVDPLADVEAPVLADEAQLLVRDFLVQLPPVLRCIAFRHFWLEQSQAEIAKDLGVTRSAICHGLSRVFRTGRRALAGLAPA